MGRRIGAEHSRQAERYQIPLGTLRHWEQHRGEPDGAAKAYLKAIRAEPEAIARALAGKPAA